MLQTQKEESSLFGVAVNCDLMLCLRLVVWWFVAVALYLTVGACKLAYYALGFDPQAAC